MAVMNRKTPRTRSGTVPILHLPDRDRWQLTIHADGKRKRTYHETEAEAEKAWKDHCAHLKRFGTNAAQFSPEDLREFAEARRILPGVDLWDWLGAFRGEGKIRVPGNETMERIRRDELPKVGIPVWPQNALRHTFCTMLMSLHGDAAKVANWSRHTNASQLYRSYVARLVSREEAGRFCGIVPASAKQAPPLP